MYSKNVRTRDSDRRFGETLPPGYDGSRFSRRHRGGKDEIVVVPDSEFAVRDDDEMTSGSAELSRNGIVNASAPVRARRYSTRGEKPLPHEMQAAECRDDEPIPACAECDECDECAEHTEENAQPHSGGIGELLRKIGLSGDVSNEDILLFALIFMLVSDSESGEGADIIPVLALLLASR